MGRQRLYRRKVAGNAWVPKLVHLLQASEVLELMRAQIAQGNGVGQRVLTEVACRLREKRLSAVPCREESCDPVEGLAEIVAVPGFYRSGVQRHPHLDRRLLGPRFDGKRQLRQQRGTEGIGGDRECRAKSITHRFEDVAVGAADDLA